MTIKENNLRASADISVSTSTILALSRKGSQYSQLTLSFAPSDQNSK